LRCGLLTYRVEYVSSGRRAITATYTCEQPLEVGQWIEVGGAYLVVERIVRGKRGDPYAGIALCKRAQG
jgi:hypothetical protein